ncbi:Uncharacterized protein APZ42_015110 [Daphnia magna]|uniref:Uncharacterized protein n=1 Tax=Daphnia magna TaxID=35525 RepID=A0A162P5Z7_9CRUS|nr:Uncharacterized protein APZ42_015110 [Daphnia magna]
MTKSSRQVYTYSTAQGALFLNSLRKVYGQSDKIPRMVVCKVPSR